MPPHINVDAQPLVFRAVTVASGKRFRWCSRHIYRSCLAEVTGGCPGRCPSATDPVAWYRRWRRPIVGSWTPKSAATSQYLQPTSIWPMTRRRDLWLKRIVSRWKMLLNNFQTTVKDDMYIPTWNTRGQNAFFKDIVCIRVEWHMMRQYRGYWIDENYEEHILILNFLPKHHTKKKLRF